MKRLLSSSKTTAAAAVEPIAAKHVADTAEIQIAGAKRAKLAASSSPATALVHNGWTDLGQQARVGYFPGMFAHVAEQAMQSLLDGVQWQQRDLVIFGRTVAQPRLISYMADPSTPHYTYSGLTLQPQPWAKVVLEVKEAIEELQPGTTTYNSCLLNLYKDGNHHVSWHSDNESVYGPQPTIASVSFGAARDFVLRHNGDRSRKISVHLSEGDVLIMAGTTQQHWQHCVPKRKAVCHPRINLTFRTILEPAEP